MDEIFKGAVVVLISGGIIALIQMYRDHAVMKRDIDSIADLIGTKRAKARRKENI